LNLVDIEQNPLWNSYYVVYALPFGILLVHKYSFSDIKEAETLVKERLTWFSVWDEAQYYAWEGRKIMIPFGGRKTDKNIYRMRIAGEVEVEARTPSLAHRTIRTVLSPSLDKLVTEIKSVRTLLKGKDGK